MPRKFCFIINPNSGNRTDPGKLTGIIRSAADTNNVLPDVYITAKRSDASDISAAAVKSGNVEAVIVAGGDGTLNEAARALVGSPVALGVIPSGSGNGLAREMGASLDIGEAVNAIFRAKPLSIDAGLANGEVFVNVAGVGLDAAVGMAFDKAGARGRRGKLPYFYFGVREYLSFKPQELEFVMDGRVKRAAPLVAVVANGRQYGSGAIIAPLARINDGKFHITLINPRCWPVLAFYLPALFAGKIDKAPFAENFSAKEVEIRSGKPFIYHLDGEPRTCGGTLKIKNLPGALKFLVSSNTVR